MKKIKVGDFMTNDQIDLMDRLWDDKLGRETISNYFRYVTAYTKQEIKMQKRKKVVGAVKTFAVTYSLCDLAQKAMKSHNKK